jgi:tetratricopeptide (TPR) repeat protein
VPGSNIGTVPDEVPKPEPAPTVAEGDRLAPTVATGAAPATRAAAPRGDAVATDTRSLPLVSRDNYAVEGEFARGGMGRVLSARDRRLGRTVALKELQAGAAHEAPRFVREALVTARLQHPAIVPIYEAGRWPDGMPFYAMKKVSGRTLDALIRAAPDLAGRLALLPHLLGVSEAVAYAHSQRVVHRDLKPANVLVGAFGETVLVDWGLAKDLSQPSGADEPPDAVVTQAAGARDATVVGSVLGTPAYMPPEQARGQPVDERADVYALGAMLYYLLVGAPPHSGTTVKDVLAAAATQRPVPVQSREPDAPGDLVAIVVKAMDPEPARRYPTAGELAEDLRRFQTGQLVSAHRYSPRELLRRWVRQHRAAITVAAVSALALAVAIVVGFVAVRGQARIAEAERDRARLEATKAEQINRFLSEMLGSADPRTEGKQATVASLLDRASARLDDELGSQPDVKASLRLTLGQTYQGLGMLEPAERELRAALEERRKLYGPDHGEVARALEAVAYLLLDRGDLVPAEALYREAIATFERVGEGDTQLAFDTRGNLATVLENLGRFDEAEALHREVIARERRVFGSESASLATALNNLGVVLGQRGDWAAAEPLHREALEIIRRVKGPRSPDTASAMSSVAAAIESGGDLAAAESLYREALEIRRAVLGREHPDTVRSLYALAYLLRARGEPRQAEALCREALALRGSVLPDTHPMVAAMLQVLGLSLMDEGRAREAEPLLRESLELRKRTLPPGHWQLASSESIVGACLTALGRFPEAETLLLRAHAGLVATLGEGHERTLDTRKRLVALYEAWGRPRRADLFSTPAPSPSR